MGMLEQDIAAVLGDSTIPWNRLDNSSVLITGATGLIGSFLVRILMAYGHGVQVYAFVRNAEKARTMFGDEVRYIVGDITDSVSMPEQLDYIVHCAAVTTSKTMVTNPVETLMTAITGTQHMLETAAGRDLKKLVYLSSMEVYGSVSAQQNPVTEGQLGYLDLTSPRSSYPVGKRTCEQLCMDYFHEYSVPVCVARLAQTFGSGVSRQDNRLPIQLATCAMDHRDIVLHTTGESVSNFCYISDTVRAIFLLLLGETSGEIYNVCNEQESGEVREIAQLVADSISQGQISVIYDIPEKNIYGYAAPTKLRLSASKLRALGWKPAVGLEDAYKRLIAYLMEQKGA